MKSGRYSLSMILATSMSCFLAAAQQSATTQSSAPVKRLVNFTGRAADAQGKPAAAEQANEIVCSSTTACKTGFVPLFSTNGGSAKVKDSIITQSGSSVIVGGNLAVGGDMFLNGNTGQARSSGGLVKAMVYASGFGNGALYYCYNSTLSGAAATTPPCGFTIVKPSPFNNGDYIIDFGFQVEDRLFSLTPSYYTYPGKACTFTNGGNCPSMASLGVNQAEVTFTDLAGNLADNKFYIVVY